MGKVTLPKGFHPETNKHWFLLANRVDAVLYEGNLNGEFRYLRRFRNPKGSAQDHKLGSDRPGRVKETASGTTRHALAPRNEPHEELAARFARRLARHLDKSAKAGEFTDLVLMAEPHFLGLVNRELPKSVSTLVKRRLPREWKRGSDAELRRYLQEKIGA